MRQRLIPVRHPVHDHTGITGQERIWTELTLDAPELMLLLGMPEGTRLISIGSNAMTGVKITVEEPLEV
jgi:hypothetical protein